MADMAIKRVGDREYRVHGLQALAESIGGEARALGESIAGRLDTATTALVDWHGAHSTAFVERANGLLSSLVTLRLAVDHAAARCASFPDEPVSDPGFLVQYAYQGARIHHADDEPDTSSAVPGSLRAFATASADLAGPPVRAAAAVTTDGLTAEVAVLRPLTAEERDEHRAQGVPHFEIPDIRVWGDHQPVAVTEVFGLPDLAGDAATAVGDAEALADWVTAVAYAFERSDEALLDLLLQHPEIAGYFVDGLSPDGRMTGEAALAIVLANLSSFDTAGRGGDPDGVVGLSDLQAVAGDESLPPHVRDAAQYLLDNRLLLSMVTLVDQPHAYEIEPDDATLTADRLELFLEFDHALNAVALDFPLLDTAAHGGEADGYVSVDDLRAAAGDSTLPAGLRDAASFLLANGMLTQRMQAYENANFSRLTRDHMRDSHLLTDDPAGFTREGVIALAIDQQAFPDPEDAERFVLTLPVADVEGNGGLPISLVSDEGTKALANSALVGANGDLTDQHAVIAHLPETTGWGGARGAVEQAGGVRNTLINGFYDLLAQQADELFAGDLAGHPDVPGHPGANWLMFAPWASNGVHGVITGDITGPLGFTTSGIQQAAADGNQFIFNDIGSRFAAFIELYEANPRPSEAELERFFADTFDEGDGTIRDGFAAYVAALEEDDPARRQWLMFQGNTLVATHEQAGVQPYLERVSFGPDQIATRFVELEVGDTRLRVTDDVPPGPTRNNLIIPASLLSLDTGGLDAADFAGDPTRFRVGGEPTAGVVDLDGISGHEAFQPDYSGSTRVWWEEGSGDDATDPESLHGSDASSWPDWEERMNYILRLFEQNHTNPALYRTGRIGVDLDDVSWLDPEARPGG